MQVYNPELECFDTGHVSFAKQLVDEGLVEQPMFQFCLGIPWVLKMMLRR